MAQHLMVVDDDRAVLDLIRAVLESDGYLVRTFDSSPNALLEAVKDPPDAMIIDLMMPEMDGLELLKALRSNPSTVDVPAIVCSAYYENLLSTRDEMDSLGVARIRKPFHVEDLLDTVAAMAGRRLRPKRSAKKASAGPGRVSRFAASCV
ncbi:MAG TPA: response regulator [Chloroflexota bacterium]